MKSTDKTRRGVYINLENSPYKFHITNDNGLIVKTYYFSSNKKMQMFHSELERKKLILDKLYGKIYRIIGQEKVFNIQPLLPKIVENVYNNMRYK